MKGWLAARRRRVECMHGTPRGKSHVSGHLIDLGRRKLFTCSSCGKRWVV